MKGGCLSSRMKEMCGAFDCERHEKGKAYISSIKRKWKSKWGEENEM